MVQNIKDFYDKFSFADMVLGDSAGAPPKLLADFFQGDVTYIAKELPKGKEVLEVGCGFGRLLTGLSKVSKKVTGIDFSDLQLSEARKRVGHLFNVELHNMHAESLRFPDRAFDVAICLNSTLGNMPGIEAKVVSEMARVVRPGGLIAVRVFANTPEVKKAQFANYRRLNLTNIRDDGQVVTTDEGFYSRRFIREELLGLFLQAGLTPIITQDTEGGLLAEARKESRA